MYQMLSIPQIFRCKSILHIVDTREQTESFKATVAQIPCESHQVLKLGETIMNTARFREFPVVMVHDTNTPHRFLQLLQQFEYIPRLREVAVDKKRLYVGVGNGAALLQQQMTLLPAMVGSMSTDLSTPLLGIVKKRCIFRFDGTLKNVPLLKQILAHSLRDNFYLFPDGTGYTSRDKKFQGKIYMARMGKLYSVVSKEDGKRDIVKLDV